MTRLIILALAITSFFLWALSGCGESGASLSAAVVGVDTDSDTDTDTGVPINYPEAINPFMNPSSLMTGPISPPPENRYETGAGDDGEDLDDEDFDDQDLDDEDLDAGEPEEEL